MKIILPVLDDMDKKEELAEGLHNSEYVCIHDTEIETSRWMKTRELCSDPGNLGLILKRYGIQAIICTKMQLMALGLFSEMGLEVFRARGSALNENIRLFLSGQLELITAQNASGTSSCSSSCSSCSSACN